PRRIDQPYQTRHRPPEPYSSVTSRSAMMVGIDSDRKGALRPAADSSTLRLAGRSRLLQFVQEPQRHVEREVVLAVGIEPAAWVFDQDGRAAGDPVDAAEVALAVELEADGVADVDAEGDAGLLARGDQVVECPLVGEDPPGQGVEVRGAAIGAAPAQEL